MLMMIWVWKSVGKVGKAGGIHIGMCVCVMCACMGVRARAAPRVRVGAYVCVRVYERERKRKSMHIGMRMGEKGRETTAQAGWRLGAEWCLQPMTWRLAAFLMTEDRHLRQLYMQVRAAVRWRDIHKIAPVERACQCEGFKRTR